MKIPDWLVHLIALVVAAALGYQCALAQVSSDQAKLNAAWKRANALYDQSRYADGIAEGRKALDLAIRVYGDNDQTTAAVRHDLARLYHRAGQYKMAEALFKRSLQVREEGAKNSLAVANTAFGLAMLYLDMGQYDKAETLYQRALEIRKAKLGEGHVQVADSLGALGMLAEARGQFAKAEDYYVRALQIEQKALGAKDLRVAGSLNNLATLKDTLGQHDQAEALYRRGLRIQIEVLGEDHVNVARVLNNLAWVYIEMGRYADAESLHERSLKIRRAKLGEDHPDVADSLFGLGRVYLRRGDLDRAESAYQRSLEIREAKLPKDHPDVAASLSSLATIYHYRGKSAQAELLYKRSLKISEQLDKNHPVVAYSLSDLANLYRDLGRYDEAEPLYRRSLQILEANFSGDHAEVLRTLNNLALLYSATKVWERAMAVTEQERRAQARYVGQILPILASADQLRFLGILEYRLADALSLALIRRSDANIVSRSAGWLLNAKGVAQQALTERALLERDATDPPRRAIVRQLTAVRQQQAALALMAPIAGLENDRSRQLQALTDKQQSLEQQLVRAGGTRPAKEWTELDDVRAALPANAVFIDLARFHVSDFQPKGREIVHYAAWLIPAKGKGEVRLVDLGEADPIDAAVAAVRKGLLAAQGGVTQKSVITEKGEADAEKDLQPALAALAKLVLQPLREHIDGPQQWLISPDAALWLVPWEALPLDDQTYAIEKHSIRYLVSGRDLVTPAFQGKINRDASVIMADPDFDIDPKEAATLTAKLLGKQPTTNSELLASLDNPAGTRSSSALGRVGRLPGTAAEATAIKPKLQVYGGEEPWVYRGKNALEGIFKSFRSPKVMVLSTHGFFLEDQEFKRDDRAELDDSKRPLPTKDGKLPENPLLRCGLLLAGCNLASQVKPGQEDGVLTGLEIVGCDLRGTELVVLSACETGLGQVRNGEGVAGLRQAFQLAGAQTVVSSLWQVSDRDTALLMTDFFDGLAKGKSKADALREAQLARIKAHRDRDGAAHPLFWAAFTVTGR